MRILHTSDWHLGKHLEGFSRLEEQKIFIDELCGICDRHDVKVVIVAGDVYDTSNPQAQAEKLYYDALKRLSDNGERAIFVIAGNHDSPDRIQAAWPLASEQAILLAGHPVMDRYTGPFGKHRLSWLGDNVFELEIGEERLRIGLLPYPSERRLGEVLVDSADEKIRQASYSNRVGHLFSKMDDQFTPETFNIAVSHIFVLGGTTTESERPIQLGGTLVVDPEDLPQKADYIALGHLHRPQAVRRAVRQAHYAGAPLQYSRSEIGYAKSVTLLERNTAGEVAMEHIPVSMPKPIEVWRCKGIMEALEKCEENKSREVWVYLEIETDSVLAQSDIKALKTMKPDLLSIMPILEKKDEKQDFEKAEDKSFETLFSEYYEHMRGVKPSGALQKLLGNILNDEVDDETDQTDDQWIEQLYRDSDD